MARPKKKDDDTVSEVGTMDFDHVKKLYFSDIKPGKSQSASHAQTVSEAMKVIKKTCHVEPQGARAAFKAFEMEGAMREVHIRSLVGTLNALLGTEVLKCNFGDMVDQMQAEDGYARPKPALVAVPTSDGSETDLADAADDFESSEEELAQQEGRAAAGTESEEG